MIPQKISEITISYKNKVKKDERIKITSSQSVYRNIKPFYSDFLEYREAFKVILLNNSNDILGVCHISDGGMTSTLVDVRLIFQFALKAHAVGVILVHNHPSGTLKPSEADKRLTQRIKEAGSVLDIKVLDHIILTENSYFSFADEGIL